MTAFEWDEAKRAANLAKHGLDFDLAQDLLDGRRTLTRPSPRAGKPRFITIGEADGRMLALVWTPREAAVRMISLRRARDDEKRAYHAADIGRDPGEADAG